MNYKNIFFSITLILLIGCQSDKKHIDPLFKLLDESETGIDFANNLKFDNDFNVYKYRNFYNGGGVAIGDINNDDLQDIYFTSNQGKNRLYLNLGNFKFKDITDQAQVSGTKPWSTGVAMTDINADGYLDIYVCNSGDLNGKNKQNELFINNGNGTFSEKAEEYNLADNGFSTHASFFDYDKDGDLDAYILNNSYQAIGSFNLKRNERPKRDKLGGDKLMENIGGKFVDVSEKAGIYGSVIGFGLGVTVGDVNNDGWEDIYVSNDFFERDYLYINNKNGTFSEDLENEILSISGASMGADMADINNDGFDDIFVTEMLPSDYSRLKTVTTFEDWNKYQLNVTSGYHHQFTRNTLQLNNQNRSFSEIGRLSGIEASDWSWGALFFDMDNDGLKDLFIANGIYKDLTNQDYLQYISNEEVLKSMVTEMRVDVASEMKVDYARLIDIIPSNKLPNHSYKNLGNLKFETYENSGLQTESFSNGSAYGDLDNDGDLDLVVNNVNMKCFVYQNTAMDNGDANYLKLVLKGDKKNTYAIGSKIKIPNYNYSLENQPVRGFQSSMDVRPNFGLNTSDPVSVEVFWPSGKKTLLNNVEVNQTLVLSEKDAKEMPLQSKETKEILFNLVEPAPLFKHIENNFIDFNRDRLIDHMCSTEGPKMSMADVNGDGIKDIYIGGSKGSLGQILTGKNMDLMSMEDTDFTKNIDSEDSSSLFFDADNDGDMDLYVCSGGVEFSKYSSSLSDRLYFNDGSGNFKLSQQKLPNPNSLNSTSTVIASDIDKDGDLDLFVGERIIPLQYGSPCSGFLLQNDGKGNFTDITDQFASELKGIGMITDGIFMDLDNDGDEDLIIVGEFMGVEIFVNDKGTFNRKKDNSLSNLKGWWNTIESSDLDNDGDLDLIVGNHGLNSRFKASKSYPITLYSNDFDNNGFIDPILAFRAKNGKDYPYALRHNLIDQIKSLKKQFPDYESFKDAGIHDIFSSEQMEGANILEVNTLSSVLLTNNGNFNFEIKQLPVEAQFSPVYAIGTGDFDKDGDQDIILGGNLYGVKPEVGRYDASYGVYLENLGDMSFKASQNGRGFAVKGQVRDFIINNNKIIVARNNDSLAIFKY